MLELTTEFECGSGVLVPVTDDQWRLDTVGDPFGYNRYFCVQARNPETQSRTLRLSVHPDPKLGATSHFMTHFPSHLWYCYGDWQRWVPVTNTWPDAVRFHDDHIELAVPIASGATMLLATNPPLRCTDLTGWLASQRGFHVDSIGQSVDGREIPLVRLGRAGGRRWLILAGMHCSEHSGVWASQGVIEYLSSGIAEARQIVDAFDIAVVPMLNPDGNVRGYSGANAQRLSVNNSLDFEGVAAGRQPQAHENALLWSWIAQQFQPDLLLHFHGYMGWKRGGDPPYDGLYTLPDPETRYADPAKLAAYRAILARLLFETSAFSSHWRVTGTLTSATLDHQLATCFGTLSFLYEVNAGSVGASEQFRRGPQVLRAIARALLQDLA